MDFYKVKLTESTLVLLADLDPDNNLMWTRRVNLTWTDSDGAELPDESPKGLGPALRRLDAGVYYIRATGSPLDANFQFGGQYNIQAVAIPDHGDASESAAQLKLAPVRDASTQGNLDYEVFADFHSLEDSDFFKVELSADTEVVIEILTTWGVWDLYDTGLVVTPVSVDVFDADGNLLYPHVPGLWGNQIPAQTRPYKLEAGTYYFRLLPYEYDSEFWSRSTTYYTIMLHLDAEYTKFIAGCTDIETAFDDPLLGCQGHLISPKTGGLDINVADVWAKNKGEGVNVAVVDRDLDGDHEDLSENVVQTFSFDYTGAGEVLNPVKLPRHIRGWHHSGKGQRPGRARGGAQGENIQLQPAGKGDPGSHC